MINVILASGSFVQAQKFFKQPVMALLAGRYGACAISSCGSNCDLRSYLAAWHWKSLALHYDTNARCKNDPKIGKHLSMMIDCWAYAMFASELLAQ